MRPGGVLSRLAPGPTALVLAFTAGLLFTESNAPAEETPGDQAGAEPSPDPSELPRVAPTEPEAALETMTLRPGFVIEIVAAEPLVVDPIAIAFAEDGALFAVEMRGYSEHRDEQLGRIRRLTDEDGDGRYDRSTIYAADFAWPTGIACWKGGVFVIATPGIHYLADRDGDGFAEERREVWTGLGEGRPQINVQALANSLTWGLDNRIHGASAGNGGILRRSGSASDAPVVVNGHDFSFDPLTLQMRQENGGGQYGLAFDDGGNKFVCSNSHHLQAILYPARYNDPTGGGLPLPRALADIAIDGPAAEVFRLSPDEPWRIVRTRWRLAGLVPGPVEGGGRVSGYFTAACGLSIYRGHAFPDPFSGNAFIADAGSNLVHRKIISWRNDGPEPVGTRAEDEAGREFLASTDNWFRPVQIANGPDGALYVVDMYREIVEHPWSLPASIKRHLDLDSGNDRGRIYRIVPEGFERPGPASWRLADLSSGELARLLAHPNGWHRDTAARLLYERQDDSVVPALRAMAGESDDPRARLHGFAALAGLESVEAPDLVRALGDADASVRRLALAASEADPALVTPEARAAIERLAEDPSPQVRLQLGLAAASGRIDLTPPALARLVAGTSASSSALLRAAAVRACGDSAPALCEQVASRLAENVPKAGDRETLVALIPVSFTSGNPPELLSLVRTIATISAPAVRFEAAGAVLRATRHRSQSANAVPAYALRRTLAPVVREAVEALAYAEDEGLDYDSLNAAAGLAALSNGSVAVLAVERLAPLVGPAFPPALQRRAVDSLAEIGSPPAMEALADSWPRASPLLRQHLLQHLLQRESGAAILLDAIDAGRIPVSALNATDRTLLGHHRSPAVAARVADLVDEPDAERPRASTITEFLPALDIPGDAERGRAHFAARCASCHRADDNTGSAVGPDVASFRSAGSESVLVNIIDPNREVAPQYAACLVETRSDETLLGILAAEGPESVTLRLPLGQERTIARESIVRMDSLPRSLMPDGLESGLGIQEMADLLAFLSGD